MTTMIWTDVIEEYPPETHIHPLYEGKGWDGRKYRPVWHAIESSPPTTGRPRDL